LPLTNKRGRSSPVAFFFNSENKYKETNWLKSEDIVKEKKISTGAFGKVYVGKYGDERVAIKYLTGNVTEEQVAAFQYEVGILR
jgi:hypothetical protein